MDDQSAVSTEGSTNVARPADADAASRPPTQTAESAPDWLVNLAALGWRVLVVAGLILVAGYLASLLWVVTASVLLAIVVAALFAPLVTRLQAGGRSRGMAAMIAWIVAIGVVLGLLLLLGVALLPVVSELLGRIEAGLTQLQAWLAEHQVPAIVGTVARDAIGAIRDITGKTGGDVIASAASIATILILATFVLFYFLRDGDKAWRWIFQAVGEAKVEQITQAGEEALGSVGGYLRATSMVAVLVALSDFVFMFVLGVPMALPLAIMVFFASFIPYFGGFAAGAIVLLITYSELGLEMALSLLVLFLIRDIVMRIRVRPRLDGQNVHIQPVLAIVVLLAGYEIIGVVGLVIAVPLTAVVLAVAAAAIAIVQPSSPPQLPGLVPAWLDRMAQFSWRILVGIGFVALLIFILTTMPLVLLPIIVALIVAATLGPMVTWLMGRGLARTRAAAVAVGGTFVTIAVVLALAVVALVEQAGELGDTVSRGAQSTSDSLGGYLDLPSLAASDASDSLVSSILTFGQTFGEAILVVIVSAFMAFYFLRDGAAIWDHVAAHFRAETQADARPVAQRAVDVLGGYMIGTAAISFVGAFSQYVIMVVLGLPLALPVFVLSFILSFIPYIGGFVSTGIAFLITVAVGSNADIVIMFIWTIVFNLVTGNIVAPQVYGKTVHIHPAIVLVAIPAGSAIAGILGMFIVVPALGIVAVTWRTVIKIMGDRAQGATPSPQAVATSSARPVLALPAETVDTT
jgi:putative heme transporter